MNITKGVSLQHNKSSTDISIRPTPEAFADHLLDVLYARDTSPEDYRAAHFIWQTWFMRQSVPFKRQAVKRYRMRREQSFQSMYTREATS